MDDVVDAREDAVERVLSKDWTCEQAGAWLGVCRQTMQRYVSRYRAEGVTGLIDRSRRPLFSPAMLPPWVEDEILLARKDHPRWGARKIRWLLRNEPERLGDFPLPAASTIHQVLVRHGEALGVRSNAASSGAPPRRFRAKAPNMLWQIDVWEYELDNGQVAFVIDIIDDHSRFLIASRAVSAVSTEAAWQLVADTVAGYGMPARILTDNDLIFTGRATNITVKFERQAADAGIRMSHGKPRHPQTQGKIERSHRTVEDWLEDEPPAGSIEQLQEQLDRHRDEYNHLRPHDELAGDVPADHYRRGEAKQLPTVELEPAGAYPDGAIRRRVKHSGIVHYRDDTITVGTKYAGTQVGLIHRGARLHVYYGAAEIATYALGYQPPAGSPSPPHLPKRGDVKVERPQRSEDERP